jgi:hypothetical protein
VSEWNRIVLSPALKKSDVSFALDADLSEVSKDWNLQPTEEILKRIIALWCAAGYAQTNFGPYFPEYVETNNIHDWLTGPERKFVFTEKPSKTHQIHFSWRTEHIYFLLWCVGVIPQIDLPIKQSRIGDVFDLFPQDMEQPEVLRQAMKVRPKEDIVAWAEVLHEVHGALRRGKLKKTKISIEIVQEWHHAVNWILDVCPGESWEFVTTDT